MIKTNKLLLGLGLSTFVALPLVIVSCDSDEEVIITNLALSPKTNIGVIAESEVAHLSETYQDVDVNDGSLTLIKKLFDIQGTETTDQNLRNGLQIKMLPSGSNKKIWLSAKTGFKINGTLTEIDSMSFAVNVPPIEPPVLGDILTQEIANDFFASGGKWAGKTSLVAKDFEGFKTIGNSTLSGKSLISVIFPNSITIIGQNALANNQLTSLSIPNSVTEIGNGAFANNRLTLTSSITLPAQFDNPAERERIGLPFAQPAINLELTPKTNIEVIAESEVAHLSETYQDVNDGSLTLIKKLFDIQGTTTTDQNLMSGLKIKMLPNGSNKKVWLTTNDGFTINGGLTEIDSANFTIDTPPILGDILTQEIANSFFASGGKWAGKTTLVEVDFEGFTSIANSALSGKSLISVIFPNSITIIGQNALANNQLTSLSIPNSVTEIGNGAFANNRLTLTSSITLPAQFDNPAERERIGLPFAQPAINLELTPKTNIEVIAESEVAHLSETYQDVNDGSLTLIKKLFDIQGTTTTDQNLMSGLKIKMLPNGSNKKVWLTTNDGFTINGGLTEIDSANFTIDTPPILGNVLTQELVRSFFADGGKWHGQTTLVAEDFKGFTSIGDSAFQGLVFSLSIDLPDEITRIEDQGFFQTNLEHITLGNRVEYIGNHAFSHCFITEIILPPSLKTMVEGAFFTNNLTSIIIPSSLKIIPNGAFSYNKLTSISIPNSVTEIGDNAFFDNELTEINIPNSVISIGSMAFAANRFSVIPNLPNGITVGDIFNEQKLNQNLEISTRKTIK